MKNRKVLALLAAVVIIAFAYAMQRPFSRKEAFTIKLGTFSTAIDYAPYYVARHHGWFAQEVTSVLGEQVAVDSSYEFTSLGEIVAAMKSGKLHMLFSAETPAILIQSGQEVELQFAALGCTLQQEIVARDDETITSISDLKGKKIAVLTGTSSHYGLLRVLKENEVDPSDVTLLDMPPGVAEDAFETSKIDAWAVWPPFPERRQSEGNAVVLRGGDAVIHSVVSQVVSQRRETQAAQAAIAKAVSRAKMWMLNNPEEAQSIVAKETGETLDIVRLAWPKHDWAAEIEDDVIVDFQNKAEFLNSVQPSLANRLVDVQKEMLP